MSFLRLFFIPLSFIYAFFMFLRNKFFDLGILKSNEYSKPIISIGNLCIGGTGKSPLIEYILSLLKNKKKVAVLSRGYGRKTSGFRWVKYDSNVFEVGDEPLQMANKFTDVSFAVSENRNKGIQKIFNSNYELILLDDAYQHRWVKPGLSILLTTYDNLFTKDYLVPYGKLRESKNNFNRADIIIITKTPNPLLPDDEFFLKEQVNPNLNQKLYFSYLNYLKPISLFSNISHLINGKKIILVTAIASSSEFKNYIKTKSEIYRHFEFRDHHNFKLNEIKNIISCFNMIDSKEKLILTTEKDATRLAIFEEYFVGIPIAYIPVEIKFHRNSNFNKSILKYVKQNKINS